MGKLKYALLVATLGVCTGANAASLELSAGADAWFVDAKGYAGEKHSFELRREYDNRYAFFAWMNLEHPLPIVPNLGVRYGTFDHTSNGIKADFNYADAIGYYNVLDLTPLKIDAGVGLRFEDFAYEHVSGDASYNEVLPFAYGHGRFDLVGSAFSVDADVSFSELPFRDDTEFLDAKLGVEYRLGGSFIEWSVNGGYRYMYLTQDTSDYNSLTTIIKGPYAGVSATF